MLAQSHGTQNCGLDERAASVAKTTTAGVAFTLAGRRTCATIEGRTRHTAGPTGAGK